MLSKPMWKADSMTTSDVSSALNEELFQELAASTWRQRIRQRDDEDMPDLPSLASIRVAIMEGELDEGLPEFHERVSAVEEVCGPDNLSNADEAYIRMEGRNELYVRCAGQQNTAGLGVNRADGTSPHRLRAGRLPPGLGDGRRAGL